MLSRRDKMWWWLAMSMSSSWSGAASEAEISETRPTRHVGFEGSGLCWNEAAGSFDRRASVGQPEQSSRVVVA